TREQFGTPIERLAPVAEMVTDMRMQIEAARAFTYETARVCDLENNTNRLLERNADALSADEKKGFKQNSRTFKRLNAMLTPMSKLLCGEMSIDVAGKCVQVLGGSGYLKDYPAERYLRDARITTIYEGTSQLQVVAAIRGVTSGVFATYVEQFEKKTYDDPQLESLKQSLIDSAGEIAAAVDFVKSQSGAYVELVARQLVESATFVLCGHYLLGQATHCDRKKRVANLYILKNKPRITMLCDQAKSGNTQVIDDYELIAGPVPAVH
ncbi:MAG TPA: hypothetical protein DEB39_00660, partial [Planctomycetaceae bacterium]|nr:hypothetical protein [Planctomycetaceae bacterium]